MQWSVFTGGRFFPSLPTVVSLEYGLPLSAGFLTVFFLLFLGGSTSKVLCLSEDERMLDPPPLLRGGDVLSRFPFVPESTPPPPAG